MDVTSTSLLLRLREPGQDEAWARFVRLYTPLMAFWARRIGLQEQDADDLIQDVFGILLVKLPEFSYQPGGSFRGWLRTVLMNCWRNWQRKRNPQLLADAVDVPEAPYPAAFDPAEFLAEVEYRDLLVKRALELLRTDFEEKTWRSFWETEIAGRSPADVAAELNMNVGTVYVNRSRVLNRLREELAGLLD
jgi:RNA polymerase sigma-70 factor (ECF subfamily)